MAFQKLRAGLRVNVPPARGEVLEAAKSRLHSALAASTMLGEVEVGTTDDPDRLLVALVTYRSELSEQAVVDILGHLWVDELRYLGWDAYAFLVEDGHVEFQAASMHEGATHYVTAHVIATAGDFEDIPVQRTTAPPTSTPVPGRRWRRLARA